MPRLGGNKYIDYANAAYGMYTKYGPPIRALYKQYQKYQKPTKKKATKRTRNGQPKTETTWTGRKAQVTRPTQATGFFKRTKKISRRTKSFKIGSTGGYYSYEKGGVSSAKQCLFIGHSTLSTENIQRIIAMSIVKSMATKGGMCIRSWDDIIPDNAGTHWKYDLTYRADQNSLSTPTTVASAFFGVTATWWDMVEDLQVLLDSAALQGVQTTLIKAELYNSDLIACVMLQESLVGVDLKSSLKIQNRSTSADGELSGDVDNVPLYGKTYEGSGNGTVLKGVHDYTALPFIADKDNYIASNGDFNADTQEPPNPYSFRGVRKSGKVHLEPGHLKTSVLTQKFNVKLATLVKAQCSDNDRLTEWLNIRLGKYRMFALEKMIETEDIMASMRSIEIGYEIAVRIGAKLMERRNLFTAQKNFRQT